MKSPRKARLAAVPSPSATAKPDYAPVADVMALALFTENVGGATPDADVRAVVLDALLVEIEDLAMALQDICVEHCEETNAPQHLAWMIVMRARACQQANRRGT